MALKSSDARRRELGAELRKLRERAGMNGVEMARKVGWSQSTVSRIESGVGEFSEITVMTYLAHCGVSAPEAAEVLKLARETEDGYLVRRDALRTLILHETRASRVTAAAALLVPGLLQTEDYARAIIGLPGRTQEELDSRVAVRMGRQQVLKGWRPAQFTYYLYEAALHCPFGGDRVMNEQMLHLGFLADRPHITIRVVPFEVGQNAAAVGDLTLMEFKAHSPVAYADLAGAGMFVEHKETIQRFRSYLARLANDALDEGQSREFLARLAYEYDQPEEPDEHAEDPVAEEQP